MPHNDSHIAAIHLAGATKRFGEVVALDGVDLALPRGELVALVGANGSGKSTLLKLLTGILDLDAGQISVLGLHPHRDRSDLGARIGYAEQDATLDGEITGRETLHLFHALRRLPDGDRRQRLDRLAEEFDLASFQDRFVRTYSGGQRQRLHLAIETMHHPELIILDEPTSSLDPGGRRALWSRLRAMRDDGQTVLVATHDLPDVASHCDRVVLLRGGHLLADDHPDRLIATHGRNATVVTLARSLEEDDIRGLRRALAELPGNAEVSLDGATVTLWREQHPDVGEPAIELLESRGLHVRGYERREPDLAQVYFRLTGDALPAVARSKRGGGKGGGRRWR